MINELISKKENFFWSKSDVNSIIVGGNDKGRFYGQIEIIIDEEKVIIKRTISNGVSFSKGLENILISKDTLDYQNISKLFSYIDEYISEPNTQFNQEINRANLMQNVLNFLPLYSELH